MAQCYQCGSSVDLTDRFCMECGADYPARQSAAPPASAAIPRPLPDASPEMSIRQAVMPAPPPPAAVPPHPTTPTWLPAEATPASQQKPPASPGPGAALVAPQIASATPSAAKIICPNCGSNMPSGTRFCGDCGQPLPAVSATIPPPAVHPLSAVLPDPIPPLTPGDPPKPAAYPAQSVLPPFRASGWAAQPTPEADVTNPPTWTLPPGSQAAPSPISPSPWGQAAGGGVPASPQVAAGPGAQPSPWSQTPLQSAGGASPFQSPFVPTGRGGPQSQFLQSIAAIPPVASIPRKRPLSRGQTILLLIASVVTVGAALGGLLLQLLSHH